MGDALEDVIPRLAVTSDKHASAVSRLTEGVALPDEIAAAARASCDAATALWELSQRWMLGLDSD
jgi:hypothetical protein